MERRTSIEDAWRGYSDKVFEGIEVSTAQYKETRLAFYAGVWTALNKMISISEQNEAIAVGSMTKIWEEVEDFLKEHVR